MQGSPAGPLDETTRDELLKLRATYNIMEQGERMVAQATSVCVGYDYGSGSTVPIPDVWRERLAA